MAEETTPKPDAQPAAEAPPAGTEQAAAPDQAAAPAADAVAATEEALADHQQAVDELSKDVREGRNFDLPNFQQVLADVEAGGLDLLHDVELNVKIELGRAEMYVEDVLRLSEGSVVELDKLAGDPVDVYVNERLVARGEVLVLNDNFCVRISQIVSGNEEASAESQDQPAAEAEADAKAKPAGNKPQETKEKTPAAST